MQIFAYLHFRRDTLNYMSTSTIICIVPWILLYSSSQLLSLKADKCVWPQTCGGLTFPYPFRLGKDTCGLPGFEIVCKRKSSSDPGIPYLPTLSGEVKIKHITYEHLLVEATSLYASPCRKEVNVTNATTFNLYDKGPFWISGLNKLFAVGCNTSAQFQMHMGSTSQETHYWGSCTSKCGYSSTLYGRQLPSCKENGCCQMAVPGGYTRISLAARFHSFYGSNNCSNSASAIVDKDSWDSISNSTSFKATEDFSLRVSWAILNDTCVSAQRKSSRQCSPNAECENRIWGYVCKCKAGYDGDGYSSGTGCKETKKCTGFSCFVTLSIISGVFGTFIVALLCGGTLFWILKLRKSKRDKERNFKKNGGDHLQKIISSRGGVEGVKLFSLNEIEKATNKFSQNLILGSGGYGTVYKGTLSNGLVVAVKRSKQVDSRQIDQFINEVCILSQINHRNVVKLLGCCLETSVPLLVYEYISNGTLFDHLHGNKQNWQQIPWEKRLCIATETAEALSYLHSAASIPIVHRDVKSSNILLDNDYIPKVADFGVSRLVPMGQTHITTVVHGTLGYLDPEYVQTVQLTEKSDVYSFGVVLAELLTGLRPVSYDRMDNHSNLAIYFLSTINTTGVGEIIDPRLDVKEGKNRESMRRVAALAKECLSVEGEKRPSMKEVVQELLWSKGGERQHDWLNNSVADNPEEMVGLIVGEEERSKGIRAAYSIPGQCSSSFSIEGVGVGIRWGR
ncbi:wall-associated receptor kinase-like 8 [Cryptomeria japonica]|uniref:wall-associated receptor kinase-like 8 n=1 Tax=Cryptomeria japonica TaxID=3369 RepID=UPI0027DA416B|nr:wall-associated receptor kinase-like 8 [Cryptomeria japonica]